MSSRRDISPGGYIALRLLAATLVLVSPTTGFAQADNLTVAPEAPAAPPSHLVRELLEHDAQQALAQERTKNKTSLVGIPLGAPLGAAPINIDQAAAAPPSPPKHTLGRLVAIVGVGNRLVAHMQLGGKQATYLGGKALPITGSDLGLRLLEISPPCSTFQLQDQEFFTYCLDERAP